VLQHDQLMQIYDQMVDMSKLTKSSRNKLNQQVFKASKANKVSKEQLRVEEVVNEVSDWSREVTSSIQASNGKLQAESSRIHQKMTQWMIESILYLAPDAEEEDERRRDSFTLQLTPEGLQSKAEKITEDIAEFTAYLSECVEDVVAEKKHENEQLGIKDRVWQEYAEFKNEAQDWITTAEMVLKKVSGHDIKLLNEVVAKKLIPPKTKNTPRDSTGTRQKGRKNSKKERESTEKKKKSVVKMEQLAKVQEKLKVLTKLRKSQDGPYTKHAFNEAKKRFDTLRKIIQPNKEDKTKIVEIVKGFIKTTKDPTHLKINELDPELFSILNAKEIDKIIEENKADLTKKRESTAEEAKEDAQVKTKLRKKVEEHQNTKHSEPAESNDALIEEVSRTEVESPQTSILPEQSQITDASTLKINDDPSDCFGRLKAPRKVKLHFSEDVHSQNLPSLPTSSLSPDKIASNLAEDSQMEFFSNIDINLPKKTKKVEEKNVKVDDEVEGETFVEFLAGGTKKLVLDMKAIKRLSETREDMRMIQEKFLRKQIEDHENKHPSVEDSGSDDVKVSQISMDSERDLQVSDEIIVDVCKEKVDQPVTVDRSVTEKSLSFAPRVSKHDFCQQASPKQVNDSTQLRVDTNIMNRNPLGRKNKKTQIGSLEGGKKNHLDESLSLEMLNSNLSGSRMTNRVDSSYKKPILIKKKEKTFNPKSSRDIKPDDLSFALQDDEEENVLITDQNRKEKIRNSVKFSDDKTDAEEYIIQEKVVVPKHHGKHREEKSSSKSRAKSSVKKHPRNTQTEYSTDAIKYTDSNVNESESSTEEATELNEYTANMNKNEYNKNELSMKAANNIEYLRPTNQATRRKFKAAELAALTVVNMNEVARGKREEKPKKFIPTLLPRRTPKKPHKKITYDDDHLKIQPPSSSDDSSDSESSAEEDFQADPYKKRKRIERKLKVGRSGFQNKERRRSTLQVHPLMEVDSESFIEIDEHFRRQSEVSNRFTQDFETDYNIFYDDKHNKRHLVSTVSDTELTVNIRVTPRLHDASVYADLTSRVTRQGRRRTFCANKPKIDDVLNGKANARQRFSVLSASDKADLISKMLIGSQTSKLSFDSKDSMSLVSVPYQDNAGDARLSQLNVNLLSNVEVNAIGEDANVMRHVLNDASFNELIPPCSKLTQEALDAIANVDRLQQELIDTEIRAQQAEDFVISLQEQVVNRDQKIIELEKIVCFSLFKTFVCDFDFFVICRSAS